MIIIFVTNKIFIIFLPEGTTLDTCGFYIYMKLDFCCDETSVFQLQSHKAL